MSTSNVSFLQLAHVIQCSVSLAALLVLSSCNGSNVETDNPSESPHVTDTGSDADLGSTSHNTSSGDSTSESGAEFWELVRIDAEWAEYWPTIRELVVGSDVVVQGHLIGARPGSVVQGDAPEDKVYEIVLQVSVDELFKGDLGSEGQVLELTYVLTLTEAEIEALRFPSDPIIVLARRRDDDAAADFRFVSGYGLWAKTARASVDAPLSVEAPTNGIYREELASIVTMQSLADYVRESLE